MLRTPFYVSEQHSLFTTLAPHVPPHFVGQNKKNIELQEVNATLHFNDKIDQMDRDVVISARDRRDGAEGLTLLHEAARLGRVDTIQSLLNLGHVVDCIDSSITRVTPLMEAITYNHVDVVALLVKSGAEIAHQNVRGENSFHYAAKIGSRMIMTLVNNSYLPREAVKEVASTRDVKLRFPEDMAINGLAYVVLTNLRQQGFHSRAVKNKSKPTKL